MSETIPPTTLIIFGISGDLARRKLLPAIEHINKAKVLPSQSRIVGITRQQLRVEDIVTTGDEDFLRKKLTLKQMNLTDIEAYKELKVYLKTLEASYDTPAQNLFYIAVPPQMSQPIIELLGKAGFGKLETTRLLLEKPFGTDLVSAQDMVHEIHKYFSEDQVYRIDHFLAKEMAQNLVIFRAGNSLFKRSWNNNFIESIDIVASEKIGVDGRALFYEQTGALRDVVQSHLMQLTALTLMDLPAWGKWQDIPARRLRALTQIEPIRNMQAQVIRGQYDGYKQEVKNPKSTVETFVSLTLFSKHPSLKDIPIRLTTGKALHDKVTEIRINYKQEEVGEANVLILRIQPNEGVEICLWAKEPGYERRLQQLPLHFTYRDHFNELPEAYERVFVDAMQGDRNLFTTSDEILDSWRILEPVQKQWEMNSNDLIVYKPGSTPEGIISKSKSK